MVLMTGSHNLVQLGAEMRASDVAELSAELTRSAPPPLYPDSSLGADVQEVLLERSDFHIRLASTRGHRSQVSMLINRLYTWRGYKWEINGDLPHGPNQITLQTCNGEYVFGTLTLRLDSNSGLLADELYCAEIGAYRAAGAKVCELAWLAVEPEFGTKEVLASLFHLAYIYGRRVHGVTDVFIEVNPRHVGFYEQMLGFRRAGELRICPRVNAPAVLLHLELDHVDEQIELSGGHRGRRKRSLYPYFFTKLEQEGLYRRICGFD